MARFYVFICLLAAAHLPTNPQIEQQSPLALIIERNQFDLPVTGLVEHAFNVKRGETLGSIMSNWGVSQNVIHTASEKAASFVDLQKIRRGDPLYAYTDSISGAISFLVYQPSVEHFLLFDLRDSVLVHEDYFQRTTFTHKGFGTIETSLYQAVMDANLAPELAMKLSEIFAWQISFFHLQPGDDFSILFEDQVANGQSVATEVKGARMRHGGKEFYAFFFPDDESSGFYDETGRALKRPFLQAPLDYSRISSRYSLSRFHPVQKRHIPHLGTDFAAPRGTPIVATADGSVTNAAYTHGNGNYVKIRHNDVYSTGYLHMSRIAKGIRPGVRIKQGQLIGYVGSTGLATGPHVCYRFWKNGRQIDALKVKMPPSEPLPEALMPQFTQLVSRLSPQLEGTPSLVP